MSLLLTVYAIIISVSQEGLAVARIARDDGSSSTTVLQMGMTNYQPLCSYVVCTFPLRTLYRRYARQLRVLYVGSIRTMWHRFRPMWSDSDLVISRTVFKHNAFSTEITEKKFQYRSYKQIRHVVHR